MKERRYVEYHFKIEPKMKQKLLRLAKEKKTSLSKLINLIIEEVFPLVEYFDFAFLSKDVDVKNKQTNKVTEDVWYYANVVYKRKLFAIQNHYQLQSKAQILRLLLQLYLKKIEKQGERRFKKWVSYFQKKWKMKKHIEKNTASLPHHFTHLIEAYDNRGRLIRLQLFNEF